MSAISQVMKPPENTPTGSPRHLLHCAVALGIALLMLAIALSGTTGTAYALPADPSQANQISPQGLDATMKEKDGWFTCQSTVEKPDVLNISFEVNAPANPKYSWDASQAGDGSVMVYATVNPSDDSSCDLAIVPSSGKAKTQANCANMFDNFTMVQRIALNGMLDTSDATNMSDLFGGNECLETLDLTGITTSKVTTMLCMFDMCQSLQSLDVSGFDTSNVVDMTEMFKGCDSLGSLDLSSFNTSNVTNMSYMFCVCRKLTELNVSSFDTSNVTTMSNMFNSCAVLTTLDVSSFDTSKVTDMTGMFWFNGTLEELDLSNFNTANVTDMSHMFEVCGNLKSLTVSSFDTSKVADMTGMFDTCMSLEYLDLSSFDVTKVDFTNMARLFSQVPEDAKVACRTEADAEKLAAASDGPKKENFFVKGTPVYWIHYLMQQASGAGYDNPIDQAVSQVGKVGALANLSDRLFLGFGGAMSDKDVSKVARITYTDSNHPTETVSADANGKPAAPTIAADGSLLVKVYYDRNAFDVTFNINAPAGQTSPAAPGKLTGVRYGSTVTQPDATALTMSGWKLEGWYTDAACSSANKWDFVTATMPNNSLTLYAKWVPQGTSKLAKTGDSAGAAGLLASGLGLGGIVALGVVFTARRTCAKRD